MWDEKSVLQITMFVFILFYFNFWFVLWIRVYIEHKKSGSTVKKTNKLKQSLIVTYWSYLSFTVKFWYIFDGLVICIRDMFFKNILEKYWNKKKEERGSVWWKRKRHGFSTFTVSDHLVFWVRHFKRICLN